MFNFDFSFCGNIFDQLEWLYIHTGLNEFKFFKRETLVRIKCQQQCCILL